MAQPGDTVVRALQMLTAAGSPLSGLSVGSFTVLALAAGYASAAMAAYSHGTTVAEIGTSGVYTLKYILPPAAGWFYYRIVLTTPAGAYSVGPNIWSGECETVDLAAINANVVVPVATISTSAVLGMTLALECIAYRYRPLAAVVKTQSGATVDLTQFNNFKVSIRSKDQATTKWDAQPANPYGVTIAGDSSGNLTLTFPESASGPLYTTWAALFVYAVGDFVVPATSNGWIYRCTIAGTSAASHPTFPTTLNATVADGSVTWEAVTNPVWQASTAILLGSGNRPQTGVAAVLAQFWKCTTPGATGASEPAWPPTPAAGAVITDGTVVWTYQSDWFAALISAGANGINSTNLYYEVTGDELATDETVPVIASSLLTLSRREVGT